MLSDVFCSVSFSAAQPPLPRRLRQAQRGRDLVDAHASGCQSFDGKEFVCGQNHLGSENIYKRLCVLKQVWL